MLTLKGVGIWGIKAWDNGVCGIIGCVGIRGYGSGGYKCLGQFPRRSSRVQSAGRTGRLQPLTVVSPTPCESGCSKRTRRAVWAYPQVVGSPAGPSTVAEPKMKETPKEIFLKDYKAPDYGFETVSCGLAVITELPAVVDGLGRTWELSSVSDRRYVRRLRCPHQIQIVTGLPQI